MTFQLTGFTMRFLSYFSTLLVAVSLTACGGGGGSSGTTSGSPIPALVTTAPSSLTVAVGASQTYNISGGRSPYKVSSSNVQVSIAGTKDGALTIGGVAPGTATLTVFDADAKTANIGVTVPNNLTPFITNAPAALTLAQGTKRSYTLFGGVSGYSVESADNRFVTVSVSGTTLTLNAVAIGAKAVPVEVRDGAGTVLNIAVTVSSNSTLDLFTTAPSTVKLLFKEKATFLIGGGAPPYFATSSNAAKVAIDNSNTSLTLTGLAPTITTITTSSGASSIISESETIVLRDSVGAILSFTVSVGTDPTFPLAASPLISNGNVGDVINLIVAGGLAPYRLTINNPSIATASPTSVASSGDTFTALLNNVGSTLLTVTDALGARTNVNINVAAISPTLRLSPNALEIGEDSRNSFVLKIYGGTGPYTAFSSNLKTTLATVAILDSGPIVMVSVPLNGTRCFTSTQPGGVHVDTATVVDSLGASASTIITIRDNTVAGSDCGGS